MTTAREIMHVGAPCSAEHQTLADAARIMKERDVGALPICGEGDRLLGIVTDRDIVLKCIAESLDPARVTAGEIAQGEPMVVDEQDDAEQVLRIMEQHLVRRLPVVDHADHHLVGMITEADIARHMPRERIAEFVSAICA